MSKKCKKRKTACLEIFLYFAFQAHSAEKLRKIIKSSTPKKLVINNIFIFKKIPFSQFSHLRVSIITAGKTGKSRVV
jgi:hypothetical protein